MALAPILSDAQNPDKPWAPRYLWSASPAIRRMRARPRPPISMADLARTIAAEHGVTVDDMKGDYRRRRYSHARQHFMFVARESGWWSYPQIAHFIRRDHTTVIFGVRAHRARMAG